MDSYSTLHTMANANYSAYTYYYIYVNAGDTLVYKGNTLPSPSGGPITLGLTVSSGGEISGSSGIMLLGKKKPQAHYPGPPGQGGVNSDGTFNIKG